VPVGFASLRPMLAVTDLPATVRFYVEKLGFNCCGLHGEPPVWAELERDGVAIMFNAPPRECVERDVPRTSRDYQIFYFNVQDAAALREEYRGRGVSVSDLRVAFYGMKEFEVRDPEGHWLWFGQPTDEPPTVRE
jgi:catechol 2,3-dioxygenase-like lactoylglutathione lyase family enzyme